MRSYAIDYPQLMSQAIRESYRDEDLRRLKSAHEHAVRLFDGFYRAQEVPFINHLVRTASIVMAEKAPVETVSAALLHASYFFGQFRDRKIGRPSGRHRQEVTKAVGEKVEEVIHLYSSTKSETPEALKSHREALPNCSQSMKDVLLIMLANELEDHLDLGMAFRGNGTCENVPERNGKLMVEIARSMRRETLASELEEAFSATRNSRLPEVVKTRHRLAFELPTHLNSRRGRIRTTLSGLKRGLFKRGKT
jgi:(p)ppGpp synthase/HD superfamily hydrolase